jgi:hypothetical protein
MSRRSTAERMGRSAANGTVQPKRISRMPGVRSETREERLISTRP